MRFIILKTACILAACTMLAAAASQRVSGRNLILIGWDTLRADHVGALGYARPVTPNLDSLAARSCLFTNAVSPSSWTLPAFMSIFTSLYPSEHGLTNKYKLPQTPAGELQETRLSSGVVTLAQTLKAGGYRTAAFTGGAGLGGDFGFRAGFDVYVDSPNFTGFETTFTQAIDWLKRNSGAGTFVFIHGYDTHPFCGLKADGNYKFISATETAGIANLRKRHETMRMSQLEGKSLDYDKRDVKLWTDVYDEKIFRADALLGKFMAELAALPDVTDKTVIILLSDHGEELFDHGGIDHGRTLYDEVIHVPLLVHVPGVPGRRVTAQVRTLDVFPTVIELLGLKVQEGVKSRLRGVSLAAHLTGAMPRLDAFSETDYLFHYSKRSVRKADGMKFISDGIQRVNEVYNTAADPGEKADLAQTGVTPVYLLELELLNWGNALKSFY